MISTIGASESGTGVLQGNTVAVDLNLIIRTEEIAAQFRRRLK